MIKYSCDDCNEEITGGTRIVNVTVVPVTPKAPPFVLKQKHYCETCFQRMFDQRDRGMDLEETK